ncbi:hypothetical protein [Gimesia sp.]|uniref:hypothetical protein n=1 Tax=Gimesia sp. TaxID=2024833 RepID=UPI000C3D8157|nr:hypothetical protein [Gimesia sp.]MAX35654.1 hypothetical protein [Gimesia sp.]HAH45049.1 hypothetical protein [Planctomycetaceae bacterium]HBL43578.1 hypothetical protein [Planctomycetaceae bacterium]
MHTSSSRNPQATGRPTETAAASAEQYDQLKPVDDLVEYVSTYAQQNPGTAALWCFGIGFIVGWKLKPW